MNKIIKIHEDIITIGTDAGSIKEVRRSDCSGFEPCLGDLVDIFSTETQVIVTKREPEKKEATPTGAPGGININVNNAQNIQPSYPQYVPTEPQVHVVNKVAYVLFALFLGSFGVHKFYAGRIGTAIVYLLFCWTYIPGIIAFVEGIIAMFKPADANGRIIV